jgi:hypothetical protein
VPLSLNYEGIFKTPLLRLHSVTVSKHLLEGRERERTEREREGKVEERAASERARGGGKKKTWFSGEFEGRRATRHQDGEWGTDGKHGARTGVSERLPSAQPVATSTRCVWTQVHAGVVTISSDQPVCDRCVVFDFVARWKEDFVSMINRTFARLLMMGVFSRVCCGVLWGMRESAVSDSGRGHWFFFGVGGIGNGK